jgi:hypothetical protein
MVEGETLGRSEFRIPIPQQDTACTEHPVPEIIDPVFAKTSQYARFLLSENESFGLVFVKTGSINSGTDPDETYFRIRIPLRWRATFTSVARQNGNFVCQLPANLIHIFHICSVDFITFKLR